MTVITNRVKCWIQRKTKQRRERKEEETEKQEEEGIGGGRMRGMENIRMWFKDEKGKKGKGKGND